MQKAQLALNDARQQEIDSVAAAQATLADAQKQLADLRASPLPADVIAAQATLDQAKNSLQKLQQAPLPADVTAAQATLDQAKNSLKKLQDGALPTDVTAAQATLDQAKNSLKKLQEGPLPADVAAAQATLEAAKNSLTKLKAGPTQDDLTQAQAAIDQARANLTKVKAGSTAADIAAAQSTVDQARNNLTDLQAGAKSADVATAQAAVDQAQANLSSAQLQLNEATLTAPFDGVVADIPVTVGQTVGTSVAAVDLIDTSSYHVDMNVGESDISRVKVGQDVNLTFDALPGEVFTGTVSYVAPKATIASGVVSYLATATLDPKAANAAVLPGMTTTAAAVVASQTNVLMLPNRAIKTEGRQKVVYVVNGAAQIRVPVETGISDDQFTQVLDPTPLREGDALSLATPATTTQRPAGGLINLGGAARGGR
jgi:HlyD family secretion protein